jgi:hypothetical protein
LGWGAPIPNPDPAILTPLVPSSFDRILYSPKNWVFLTADTKVTVAGEEGFIIGDGVTPTTVSRTDGGTVIWKLPK